MLVVIVIISILIAVLLPSVSRIIRTAREAEVAAEMSRMTSAVAQFKNRFGVEPPSGIVLYEAATGDPSWSADTTSSSAPQNVLDLRRRNSRALIRQIWPDFNFAGGHDFNQDGDADDVLFLNGAECLVFFLGGVTSDNTDFTTGEYNVVGFAANPRNPEQNNSVAGNRIGPFHEFDSARLVDTDGDRMPEYLDSLNSQRTPMLYFSSYGGRGYQPWGMDLTPGTEDDEIFDPAFVASGPVTVYFVVDDEVNNPGTYPAGTPWNENSYQLLSPGYDGEYGHGGEYTSDFRLTPTPMTQSPAGPRPILEERDHITNFRRGRLGD
jgi:hypothetical protein